MKGKRMNYEQRRAAWVSIVLDDHVARLLEQYRRTAPAEEQAITFLRDWTIRRCQPTKEDQAA